MNGKNWANISNAIKYEVMFGLSISIFRFLNLAHIVKVKVKVMNISTANISKIVTDRANITSVIKYEVAYGISISIFRFNLSLF